MTELERLRAVLEAATPGPWVRVRDHVYQHVPGYGTDREITRYPIPDDARAIAALGSLWPALLRCLECTDVADYLIAREALYREIRQHLPEES